MTKNPFDQFSKQFFQEFLSPLGEVRINYEIPGEPKFVDIWFTPSTIPKTNLEDLGILAKIAATPCLLEPFRNQPTEREIRSCLGKLFHLEDDLQRQAKREHPKFAKSLQARSLGLVLLSPPAWAMRFFSPQRWALFM